LPNSSGQSTAGRRAGAAVAASGTEDKVCA
jgi:hypothetical protein